MKVLITGGAGQITYSLIPLLLSGGIFGDNMIDLNLLDIDFCKDKLEGVKMEINDSNFSHLNNLIITTDVKTGFKDIDVAILLGGFPREKGMLRKDLLEKNFMIFKEHGMALENYASKDVKVLVVANPANTNCWIADKFSPSIPSNNFTCLTYLDQERLRNLISKKYKISYNDIKNVIIWGNHSNTQVPDISYINQKNIELNDDDIKIIQTRGASVIEKRGLSSALSAAQAIKKHLSDWFNGTNELVSLGVKSNGEFNIPKDIFISLPVTTNNFDYKIQENFEINNKVEQLLAISIKELKEEIEIVKKLLN